MKKIIVCEYNKATPLTDQLLLNLFFYFCEMKNLCPCQFKRNSLTYKLRVAQKREKQAKARRKPKNELLLRVLDLESDYCNHYPFLFWRYLLRFTAQKYLSSTHK